MTKKLPGETFLKKYKVCTDLVSQGISSSAGTHAVTAATGRTGPDVIVPDFQKRFAHRKSGKPGLKTPVPLDAENNCEIS